MRCLLLEIDVSAALYAQLPDHRTIEEAYQLDVKGYRAHPQIEAALKQGQTFKDLFQDKALCSLFKGHAAAA